MPERPSGPSTNTDAPAAPRLARPVVRSRVPSRVSIASAAPTRSPKRAGAAPANSVSSAITSLFTMLSEYPSLTSRMVWNGDDTRTPSI